MFTSLCFPRCNLKLFKTIVLTYLSTRCQSYLISPSGSTDPTSKVDTLSKTLTSTFSYTKYRWRRRYAAGAISLKSWSDSRWIWRRQIYAIYAIYFRTFKSTYARVFAIRMRQHRKRMKICFYVHFMHNIGYIMNWNITGFERMLVSLIQSSVILVECMCLV
jgi:hypothetical protein